MSAVAVVAMAITAGGVARSQDAVPRGDAAAFRTVVQPYISTHCTSCHTRENPDGDFALNAWMPDAAIATTIDTEALQHVRDKLARQQMPPAERPVPPPADTARVVAWIDSALLRSGAASAELQAGHITLRRLSRGEYQRTVRDLLGVDVRTATDFPNDDLGYGFDNIGAVLSVSPLLFERYATAAERIAAAAISTEDHAHPAVRRFAAPTMDSELKASTRDKTWRSLYTNGSVSKPVTLPRDGDYVFSARAYGDQAGDEPAHMAFEVNGRAVDSVDVPATRPSPVTYQTRVHLRGGPCVVGVAFTNDFYDPKVADPQRRDRNLIVETVELTGPVDDAPPPAAHRRIFAHDCPEMPLAERALAILTPLATRAWRRPVTVAEAGRLASLVQATVAGGDSFARGVQVALQAILTSPHFLFRVESRVEPRGESPVETPVESRPAATPPGTPPVITDHELATRLSYFLWSSMPDDALSLLAAAGHLHEADTLRATVKRMLADGRASALAENFAVQWLELRALEAVSPDAARFAAFDDELRSAMRRESELLFDAVLRENRSVWTLIDADFTFVNERLATHYGIVGVRGADFHRVAVDDTRRGGLLAHAGIQTLTSNPTRTSPVKRGKWLLDNILDASPPPPPPNAGALDDHSDDARALSFRDQLARHRREPACASCHTRMDALGFALENYDAIGRWRDRDGRTAVDASGTLPDGRTIHGPAELRAVLRGDHAFLRCLTRKLVVYALGRGLTDADAPAIDALVVHLPAPDPTLGDIIAGIVLTPAFRQSSTP